MRLWMRCAVIAAVGMAAACATTRTAPVQPIAVSIPRLNAPVALLVQNLSSPDADTRSAAAWELAGATSLSPEATAALRRLLDDPERSVRYAAAWTLGHFEPAGEPSSLYSTPPKPTRQPPPRYPQRAFDEKIQGMVLVEILVGEQGEVAHAEIRKSIPGLDEAALACVRQWQFAPALRGSTPRAALAQAPVGFRIY